jgi:hypothetical protein
MDIYKYTLIVIQFDIDIYNYTLCDMLNLFYRQLFDPINFYIEFG